ncbi:hypothetical protein QJS04_geneDACA014043 [Acorus gramineus]|uniref:Uncharacterized protein n=1 Tax=Acorus gramineus TaxID=55184 RepID=A0AAV9B050_ACOGR|nr:hypothetical protein QJS04_geneDACA014043 [Acorus gramineus]
MQRRGHRIHHLPSRARPRLVLGRSTDYATRPALPDGRLIVLELRSTAPIRAIQRVHAGRRVRAGRDHVSQARGRDLVRGVPQSVGRRLARARSPCVPQIRVRGALPPAGRLARDRDSARSAIDDRVSASADPGATVGDAEEQHGLRAGEGAHADAGGGSDRAPVAVRDARGRGRGGRAEARGVGPCKPAAAMRPQLTEDYFGNLFAVVYPSGGERVGEEHEQGFLEGRLREAISGLNGATHEELMAAVAVAAERAVEAAAERALGLSIGGGLCGGLLSRFL